MQQVDRVSLNRLAESFRLEKPSDRLKVEREYFTRGVLAAIHVLEMPRIVPSQNSDTHDCKAFCHQPQVLFDRFDVFIQVCGRFSGMFDIRSDS